MKISWEPQIRPGRRRARLGGAHDFALEHAYLPFVPAGLVPVERMIAPGGIIAPQGARSAGAGLFWAADSSAESIHQPRQARWGPIRFGHPSDCYRARNRFV